MTRKHGPWLIKKRSRKYKNSWIEVVEDSVVRPDGASGIFGVVRMRDGISVLALDSKGYVYLTNEFHYALGKRNIEVVSGAIDKGETPRQAAQRELEEELGIKALKWISLGLANPFTTVVRSNSYLFLATKLKFVRPRLEGTETITRVKVKFKKAVRMVFQSKITHGTSCVVILKAQAHIKTLRTSMYEHRGASRA